jgi:hypothetical protein
MGKKKKMVKIRRVLFLGYQNKQKSLLQWETKKKKGKNTFFRERFDEGRGYVVKLGTWLTLIFCVFVLICD